MAYIGHGLSHAIFGGAVVSYVLSINFFLGASAWGFLSALIITFTARRKEIAADAAIGIVTTASFALGLALISRYKTFTRNFDAALFGNILGVSGQDLAAIIVVSLISVVAIILGYKLLLFTAFDREVAHFHGVPTGWIDTGFSLILAATIVVSLQVLGVTLIASAIVIPPIVARLLTNSFMKMIILSSIIGSLCGLCGIYLSFYIDVSSGATIVLFSTALFSIVMAYTSLRNKSRLRRMSNLSEM
jgi:manganese/iron transport system permease protein/iron/zinc/copper transport system permease protein